MSLPYILFPPQITPDMLDYVGIYEMTYEEPVVDEGYIAEATEVVQIDGRWTQMWNVRERTPADDAPPPEPEPDPEPPYVGPEPITPVDPKGQTKVESEN